MLIACEIDILLCQRKYMLKIQHRSDVLMQKINNDLRYLIQFLDARYNDLWLFPLPKKKTHCLIKLMIWKWLRKLNLSVPQTCIKVDNSAALREKISW